MAGEKGTAKSTLVRGLAALLEDSPFVELPLNVTEDRLVGSVDLEAALQRGQLQSEDTVTYSDGTTEEVNGFDVPVPALDEEFDLALIGTKGKWYDHKVSVSNPVREE